MRAAVFHGNRDIRIEEVPEPAVSVGELLLEVRATGICGTDAAEYAAGPKMFPITWRHPETGHVGPMIPGHEIAGVVREVGPRAKPFTRGQLVVTGAGISCGQCFPCRAGRTNLCERYATVGLQRHGGLAQFCAVPATTCVAVDTGLTPDAAALGQPMAIAVHSMRQGRAQPGDRAVVVGAGGIGAFLVYALSELGADVTAVDLQPSRLAVAAALGARTTVLPGEESIREAVREAASPPDIVYEVTGSDRGLEAALELVRPGGTVVAVGLQEEVRPVDVRALTLREVSLVGTNAHVCSIDLPEALRLLASRAEPWADIAPVALPLDRLVGDGIEPMVEGRGSAIKTLIDPWASEPRATRMRLAGVGSAVTTSSSRAGDRRVGKEAGDGN